MEWKVMFIARVEFPSKRNLILAGSSDADAVLLLVNDYLLSVIT
jgi:2C-methyl-D-erythritol 2,4-cyclodiphosphate synthase